MGTTPECRVFLEIWDAVLEQELTEFKYMAEMADLNLRFSLVQDNFELSFNGYNDSMPEFIK